MTRVRLIVFGREDARRQWLREQTEGSYRARRKVLIQQGRIIEKHRITITAVVAGPEDYRKLMALELSEVDMHPSFKPPPRWWVFIATRIRRYPLQPS